MSTDAARLVICEHCDAVYRRRPLARGEKARCVRCNAVLYRHPYLDAGGVLALALAGLVLWVMANAWPVFSIGTGGLHSASTLWGAVMASWGEGARLVAVAVAATLFFAPLLQLLLLAWACGFVAAGHRPPGMVQVVRILAWLHPWSMIEVWMLGILVAVVKLHSVFDVVSGVGMWSFAALMVVITAAASWDTRTLWDELPREETA